MIQELYGCLLAYNAVRALMLQAATQEEGLDVDRLSFTHAICVLKRFLPAFQVAQRQDQGALLQRVYTRLREQRLPQRVLRTNPRVVKRRASKFDVKRPQHLHPPQPPKGTTFRDLILLI